MENYFDIINEYLKVKNDLICFNSYSNDVRLFRNHIIKSFNSRERLENCIVGLQNTSNSTINVPTLEYVYPEKNILIEKYINGISLNEYITKLTPKRLYDIGRLMGQFHNINISSKNDEKSWVDIILSDMLQIRQSLVAYENEFIESINIVENKCKILFYDLHFTFVHGDFRPANILYNQQEGSYYIIDFENFMIGDPTLDVYKMLSVLKNTTECTFEDVEVFLNGYLSVRKLPEKIVDKWIFYDIYYSLRSVRRAINDNNFRNSKDQYIFNADMSAQRKNLKTIIIADMLAKYINNLH